MASIQPLKNKYGVIVSYQIRVYRGRDSDGKKLKDYSMTWKIPDNWKSENKIQKELDRVATQFEIDCKAGTVPLEKKTFKQYSDYVIELRTRDLKHRTIHRYKQLLERINDEIGHMKMSDITAEHLNRFYIKLGQPGANKKTGDPLSPQTIRHHHSVIHMIFAQAIKEQMFNFNIVDTATPPKVEKKEAEFFELDEVMAISEALREQPLKWKAITLLMIDTGARRGEILGLQWENINYKDNQITIENNLQYTPERGTYLEESTKNYEDRLLNIAPEIMAILSAHRKEQLEHKLKVGDYWNETGFCFTQDNGKPINPDSINNWLDKFSERNNLPDIYPHKFRHTHASLLYSLGENPVVISKRLGHSQVSTTQNIYAHLLKTGDKNASDKIANLLYREVE